MGFVAGAAYDFGFQLAIASFHASIRSDADTARELEDAVRPANVLAEHAQLDLTELESRKSSGNLSHDNIMPLRGIYAAQLEQHHSANMANVYRLAVEIGLAEAQATSPDWGKAWAYSHEALLQARHLVNQNLNGEMNVGLNVAPLEDAIGMTQNFGGAPKDIHDHIQDKVRVPYRGDVQNTSRVA